jgi:hypothetical protein
MSILKDGLNNGNDADDTPFTPSADVPRSDVQAAIDYGLSGGAGGAVADDAEFLVKVGHADLTNERVVTDTATIVWDFATLGQAKANWQHLGLEDITDPAADRGLFWDDGEGAFGWFSAGTGLEFVGTNLSITDVDLTYLIDTAFSPGDVLWHNGTSLQRIAAGTDGQFFRTRGSSGTAPDWQNISGGGDMLRANNLSDLVNATTARDNLGVEIGVDVQAYDAGLQSISGLTTAADTMIYTTALDVYATATLTAFARSILDDASEAAFKATVNLEIGTDVQAWDADLDALAALSSTGIAVRTALNTWAQRQIDVPAAGISITNPAGIAGNPTLALANDLSALEGLVGTGIAVRSASDTWVQRTLAAPAAGFTITDSGGVAGNPTFVLANDLAALEGLGSTGFAVRSASDTWVQRSLANATAGLTWTNGDGVSGNPTPVLANDLAALEGLGSTGIAVRSTTDTWVQRTITGTANEITLTNGDGVSGNPTASLPSALTFTGKTVTGGTFASPTAITGLPDPTDPQDAATKAYVDAAVQGLDIKASVKCATTGNITLSGEQTLDGILTSASRVLVKAQSAPAENGIYTSAAGAWTRVLDFNHWDEVPGAFVFIEEGTTLGNTGWTCTSDTGGTIGSTSVVWAQFSGAGSYTADEATLQLVGTTFSVKDAELLALAGLTSAADRLPYFTGSGTAALATFTSFARSILDDADEATFKATVNLEIGVDVQAYDAELAALAGLTSAADALPYFTGAGTAATTTLTTFGRSIIDDADEATFKATVNLEIGTDVQAYDAELAAIAGLVSAADRLPYFTGSGTAALATFTAFGRSIVDDADEATFKATVNLEIGVDVQAYDADLAAIAALTTDAAGRSILTLTDPNADRIAFWDDSAGAYAHGTATNGLEISTTNIGMTAAQRTAEIVFVIDGGGSAITTGQKGYLPIDFACTITQATLVADQSGSIVIDVWKDTYANFPPVDADSITASAPPTLSTAQKSQDSTLTGWTTSIAAGDVLGFNVDSITTCTRVTITLKVTKTG